MNIYDWLRNIVFIRECLLFEVSKKEKKFSKKNISFINMQGSKKSIKKLQNCAKFK